MDYTFEELKSLIAPKIIGNRLAKEILLLMSFMNPLNVFEKFHSLLVGETGTAKSRLLDFMEATTPYGVARTNSETTSAGLIGRAGYYGQEGGILGMISNGGLWLADEIEKVDEEVKNACLEIMQERQSTATKQGEKRVVETKVNVIATANPRSNYWIGHPSLDQVSLKDWHVSRFGVVIPFFSVPSEMYPEIGARMYDKQYEEYSEFKNILKQSHEKIKKVNLDGNYGRQMGEVIQDLKDNLSERNQSLANTITPRYIESAGAIVSSLARIDGRDNPVDEDFDYLEELYFKVLDVWTPPSKKDLRRRGRRR